MTKKLMCMALGALVGVTALNAQNTPAHKTVFKKDGAFTHMFVELGNSAALNLGGNQVAKDMKFADGVTLINPSLSVGRWYNPYFATRLGVTGGELIDLYQSNPMYEMTAKSKYLLGQLDFMFDVVNYFSPYKESRFFHVIPFVGVGVGHRANTMQTLDVAGQPTKETEIKNTSRTSATAHAGLQLKFRLGKRVDFNLEGRVIANDFRQARYAVDNAQLFGGATAMAGANLTIHLGKKAFTPVVLEDTDRIARLNSDLNALRAENMELRKRPTHCPEVPAPVAEGVAVGNVVYFRLDSYKVDANQLINIRNIAEYAKNNTETISLVGYADRETGTPEYNYKLSERRAEAVKKILVEKYGISADRIKTEWHGDRIQPYNLNEWNRIVIMSAE